MKDSELNIKEAGHQIIHSEYIDLMFKRAKGEIPDMGCALRLIEILKEKVLINQSHKKINTFLDIGCATGHYYKTLLNHNIQVEKYIGLERDIEMVKAAKLAWDKEIKNNKFGIIHEDIESNNELPKNDILICYNSFMYYKSAKYVLKKFLKSSKNIIIRSYFSESNFRILRAQSKQNNDKSLIDEMDIFSDEGAIQCADYWTIYSFSYIEKLVNIIDPRAKVFWIKDNNILSSIEEEKKAGIIKRGGTEIVGDYEISYPLLQPWEILMIQK